MNERQPYEHLIADKLQQLPVPDAETSWQEMKRLLDKDHSPSGAGGKRFRPGRGRWWGAGIIAVVMITGILVFVENHGSSKEDMASAKPGPVQNTAAGTKDASAKKSNTGNTLSNNNSSTNATAEKSTQKNTEPATSDNAATNAPGSTATGNNVTGTATNGNNSTGAANTGNNVAGTATAGNISSTMATKSNGHSAKENSLPVMENKTAASDSRSRSKKKNETAKNNNSRYRRNIPAPSTGSNGAPSPAATVKKAPGNIKPGKNALVNAHSNRPYNNSGSNTPGATRARHKKSDAGQLANNTTPQRGNGSKAPAKDQLVKQPDQRRGLDELMQPVQHGAINSYSAAGLPINTSIDTSRLLNDSTRARMARAKPPIPAKEVAKKDKKPFRLNLNLSLPPLNPLSMRSDNDPWWGAGLSFNAPLPVGGQSRFKQNINGGAGLLTDYLPSPYLQFHLNQYVYLQTEINLSTPQYTPNLLVYRNTSDITGSSPAMRHEESITVQKLYYFNWPFSLHYSPFDNFYLSAGLQFSSFQSGLATISTKEYPVSGVYPASATSSRTVKFKDDSIAVKLAPNEWRWQAGAEYYWNRFTVGFRYNRSLKQLVNVEPGVGLPATSARNSAMTLFMRFNIFEGRSKDKNASTPPPSLVRY